MKLFKCFVIMMMMALPLLAQDFDNGNGSVSDSTDEKAGQVPKDTSGVRANRSFTVNGNLTGGPTYDRVFSGTTSNDCMSSVILSGTGVGVQYNVIEFHSPAGGLWDGVEVNAAGTGISDTTMTLYCDPFDPNASDQNVVLYDDDGGSGLLSAITSADGVILNAGESYFLVISLFSPATLGDGTYQLDFAGDVMEGPPCTITSMGFYVDGDDVDLTIYGACASGVDIYNSVGGLLVSGFPVDGSAEVTVDFFPDSYYYVVAAGDDPANVLASTGMTIPTLGEWGLIAFLMLLCATGVYFMRRQRLA